jgi:molybdate transport system substrate-binding protein
VKRAVLVLVLMLAGCGSSDASSGASPADPLAGPLTVFAAASLTESFGELGRVYEQAHPGADVTFSFAGSQTLVAQVQQGAPADLVATADTATMDALAGELGAPAQVLARNRLAIVTERGNPLGLRTLADLARPGVTVVLAGPAVPVGKAGRSALQAAGVQVAPVSEEADVKAVVQRVALGEADAGIAYATDVAAARGTVEGTDLPEVSNAYPAAVVRAAAHPQAARAVLDLALSGQGRRVLASYGFLPPA